MKQWWRSFSQKVFCRYDTKDTYHNFKYPPFITELSDTDAATSWTRWASRGFSGRGTRTRWWRRWSSPWPVMAWGPFVWRTVTSPVNLSPTGKMRTTSWMTSRPSAWWGSRTPSGQRWVIQPCFDDLLDKRCSSPVATVSSPAHLHHSILIFMRSFLLHFFILHVLLLKGFCYSSNSLVWCCDSGIMHSKLTQKYLSAILGLYFKVYSWTFNFYLC